MILLVSSIAINFGIGLLIVSLKIKWQKNMVLMVGIITDVGILAYFKYSDFFINEFNSLVQKLGLPYQMKLIGVTLPIGVSFFVFQELSYIIDVYREICTSQKNFFKLGLYVSMFPQLVAGPIVRYTDIASQIDSRKLTLDDIYCGLKRFIIGLSEKVMLADILANVSNRAFANAKSGGVEPNVAWLGAIAYTLQILFDFAGYSNMAIGMSRVLGFKLSENFDKPYTSRSMTEFWRRWHISLGSWFRDYVYIPLGGNRKGNVYINLLVVFTLTGLWHGAAINFVVWGLWHGFFVIVERLIRKTSKISIPSIIMRAYTILVVVFGWVLFGAENLEVGLEYIKMMLGRYELPDFIPYNFSYYVDNQIITTMIVGILVSTGLINGLVKHLKKLLGNIEKRTGRCLCPERMKWMIQYTEDFALVVFFIIDIAIIVSGNYSPFIYFRF